MQKLFRVPLLFLLIAAVLGLFLRYHMMAPVKGISFSNLLHGHSHIMFLGWVFNTLILEFIHEFANFRKFKILFWLLQICVVGMLISFPLQGYGIFSIAFSSVHTFGAVALIITFFKSTTNQRSLALTLAKFALAFFVLASIAPFYVGYLKASGQAHSNWYRFAVYFYLHFQYNGFFFFGILSLFVRLIEDGLSESHLRSVRLGSYLFLASCLPTYVLSVLWARPHILFNVVGFVAASGQLVAVCFFLKPVSNYFLNHAHHFERPVKILFTTSFAALIIKLFLQMISAVPAAAQLAEEFRSIVIAYLHLVLVGVVTQFLFGWFLQRQVVRARHGLAIVFFLLAFGCSEILLALLPWNDGHFHIPVATFNTLLFVLSFMMVLTLWLIVQPIFSAKGH